jgi:hypothetical protein
VVTAPVSWPPGVVPVRCQNCGLWCLQGRQCPVCDPATAHAYSTHSWERVDGTPTCLECDAKVWHLDAWKPCPEAVWP